MKALLALLLVSSPAYAQSAFEFGPWSTPGAMAAFSPSTQNAPVAHLPTHGEANYKGSTTGTLRTNNGTTMTTAPLNGTVKLSADFGKRTVAASVNNLASNGVALNKINGQLPNSITYTGGVFQAQPLPNGDNFYIAHVPDNCMAGCYIRGNMTAQGVTGTWGSVVNRIPLNGPSPATPKMEFGGSYTAHK